MELCQIYVHLHDPSCTHLCTFLGPIFLYSPHNIPLASNTYLHAAHRQFSSTYTISVITNIYSTHSLPGWKKQTTATNISSLKGATIFRLSFKEWNGWGPWFWAQMKRSMNI